VSLETVISNDLLQASMSNKVFSLQINITTEYNATSLNKTLLIMVPLINIVIIVKLGQQ